MSANNSYFFDNIASVFRFGKHRGKSLWSVMSENESYVYWCVNNIPEFTISKETLKQIRALFPMFIITSNFSSHIGELQEFDDYDEDDGWRDYEEEPTYERYRGSYAQDEMGYSDDDIDTIFDGDPLAYWNID
ncbi:MAG: hypothetical protein J5797_09185 [Prevotella sp.]|nr:hypothetical protein [Prevotella sp.]